MEIHVAKAPCPISGALQYSFLCFRRTETVIRLIKWLMAGTICFVNRGKVGALNFWLKLADFVLISIQSRICGGLCIVVLKKYLK